MKKVIIAILVQLLVWVSGSCGTEPQEPQQHQPVPWQYWEYADGRRFRVPEEGSTQGYGQGWKERPSGT